LGWSPDACFWTSKLDLISITKFDLIYGVGGNQHI
jgi:hypothetical protein